MIYCSLCKWYQSCTEYTLEGCRHPSNWHVVIEKPNQPHLHPSTRDAFINGNNCRPAVLNFNNNCTNFEEGDEASEEEIDAIRKKVLAEDSSIDD